MQNELVIFPDGVKRYIKRSFRISAGCDERPQIAVTQHLLAEQEALSQRYPGPNVIIVQADETSYRECGLAPISELLAQSS